MSGVDAQDAKLLVTPKRARPFLGIRHQHRVRAVDAGHALGCSELSPARVARGGKGQVLGADELRQLFGRGDCSRTTAVPYFTWGNRETAPCGSGFRRCLRLAVGRSHSGPRGAASVCVVILPGGIGLVVRLPTAIAVIVNWRSD